MQLVTDHSEGESTLITQRGGESATAPQPQLKRKLSMLLVTDRILRRGGAGEDVQKLVTDSNTILPHLWPGQSQWSTTVVSELPFRLAFEELVVVDQSHLSLDGFHY